MKALERQNLAELYAPRGGHCVTITMPRGHSWADSAQDRIRLKTLLGKAEEALIARGLDQQSASAILAEGWRLQANDAEWGTPGAGVAIFASEGFCRIFATPFSPPETAAVDRRFWLTTLAELCEPEASWRLLAVSQHRVRLFHADRFHIREIAVAEMPTNLEQTLNLDVHDRVIQYHGAVNAGKSGRQAVVHGQGGAPDDLKDDLVAYCRAIDRAIRGVLQNRHEPLVFAGVDYLYPIYREASTYPHLSEVRLAGNPDDLSAEELHSRAWPLIATHFDSRRDDALRRQDERGGGHVATNFDAVLAAADRGQVDTMFANVAIRRFGAWDATAARSTTHSQAQPGDEELVNRAIVEVLRHGGRVWSVPANRLPPGEPLSVLLRYAVA